MQNSKYENVKLEKQMFKDAINPDIEIEASEPDDTGMVELVVIGQDYYFAKVDYRFADLIVHSVNVIHGGQ